MVREGLDFSGYCEVGLLSLSSADSPNRDLTPRPRKHVSAVVAVNQGRCVHSFRPRGPLVPCAELRLPEGGTGTYQARRQQEGDRRRSLRTVAAAYSAGWRQVKLYFMRGFPTETDAGRPAGSRTRSSGRGGPPLVPGTRAFGGRVRSETAHAAAMGRDVPSRGRSLAGRRSLREAVNADRGLGRGPWNSEC